MKVLVTGASGLLGSDVVHSVETRGDVCLKAISSLREGFVQADIANESGLRAIDSLAWDAMIHTAAWRSPEACDKDPEGAVAINATATGRLAALAAKRKAQFVYISTDYVFPGTQPPYAEDAPPCPVNTYGKTKLAGEHAAQEAYPETAILRIPFLYGWRAGLERCSLLTSTLDALRSPAPKGIDDSIVRYPTCAADVAEAIMLILEKGSIGVHHFSAQDKTTRYGIAISVANLLGMDATRVVRLPEPPVKDASRPKDAHLSMERLKSLGCKTLAPFQERMKRCLEELGLRER